MHKQEQKDKQFGCITRDMTGHKHMPFSSRSARAQKNGELKFGNKKYLLTKMMLNKFTASTLFEYDATSSAQLTLGSGSSQAPSGGMEGIGAR